MKYIVELVTQVRVEAHGERAAEDAAWKQRDALKKDGVVMAVKVLRQDTGCDEMWGIVWPESIHPKAVE